MRKSITRQEHLVSPLLLGKMKETKMGEKTRPHTDEVVIDLEGDLPNKTNGRAHDVNWLAQFKNVCSAIWPLFLYYGILLLLLFYLWAKD
jgi:hypothetical protein